MREGDTPKKVLTDTAVRSFCSLYRDLRSKVQKDNPDLWKQIEAKAAAYRAEAQKTA